MSKRDQRALELSARADFELAVRVRQVNLDRLRSHVELLGDLAVGKAVGGEVGDALLRRRQRADAAERIAAWPRARGAQLGPRSLLQRAGAAHGGELERLVERLACLARLAIEPDRRAQRAQRLRVLEPGRRLREQLGRLRQVLDRVRRGRSCRARAEPGRRSPGAPQSRASSSSSLTSSIASSVRSSLSSASALYDASRRRSG